MKVGMNLLFRQTSSGLNHLCQNEECLGKKDHDVGHHFFTSQELRHLKKFLKKKF